MMFCTTISNLRFLIEAEVKRFTDSEILKFLKTGVALEKLLEQATIESGPYHEAISAAIKKFTNKTENVEIQIALELARIYDLGPQEKIALCFEMRSGFDGKALSLSDLVTNVESKTHIDCALRLDTNEWRFQIKRYPSEYLDFSDAGIVSFIKKFVCGKYGKMSDTNLIILLQPAPEAAITPINFEKIHQAIEAIKKEISFGEISFIVNANMKSIRLIRIFPDFISKAVPLDLRSPEFQELQKTWEGNMRKRLGLEKSPNDNTA